MSLPRSTLAQASVLLSVLSVMVAGTGCKKENRVQTLEESKLAPLPDGEIHIQPRNDVVTGQTMPQTDPRPGTRAPSEVADVSSSAQEYGTVHGLADSPGERSDTDYIRKADVYWKLNWARKQVLSGSIPPQFASSLARIRKLLEPAVQDANYNLAQKALDRFESGLAHRAAVRQLEEAGVPQLLVPWSLGRDAMERFIEDRGLGFGGRTYPRASSRYDEDDSAPRSSALSSSATLSATQLSALRIVRDYALRHHASPEVCMRQDWREAIADVNRLRDALGLMNRKENSDGDGIR